MQQYQLTIWQPGDGGEPEPAVLEPIIANLKTLNAEMREAGAWVFAAGLHGPGASTVVRHQDGEVLTTDGPYVEGSEFIGGYTVIQAADLDEALEWGGKLSRATTLPIEVRPLHH